MALASVHPIDPASADRRDVDKAKGDEETARAHGGGSIPPSDLYKLAVDEYRFQAQYNWSRTQYLLAFCAAVLAAACGLFVAAEYAAALVFGLGIVVSLQSRTILKTQHDYYRAARERLKRAESFLDIPAALRFDTTEGLGGKKRSTKSVKEVIDLLLLSIAFFDGVGVLVAAGKFYANRF